MRGKRVHFEPKTCVGCGASFTRNKYPSGNEEPTNEFRGRKYCNVSCKKAHAAQWLGTAKTHATLRAKYERRTAWEWLALAIVRANKILENTRLVGDCLEWQGHRVECGYGAAQTAFKIIAVHRLAYAIAHGPLVDGLVVRHKCDNPPCCNPDHLELGTNLDNVQDCIRRGRFAPVRNGWKRRLTREQASTVKERVRAGERRDVVAASVNISKRAVDLIVRGKTWRAA